MGHYATRDLCHQGGDHKYQGMLATGLVICIWYELSYAAYVGLCQLLCTLAYSTSYLHVLISQKCGRPLKVGHSECKMDTCRLQQCGVK